MRSAVLWYKGCSKVKPDYHVQYLPTNPWIHQPFEEWDTVRPHNLGAWIKRGIRRRRRRSKVNVSACVWRRMCRMPAGTSRSGSVFFARLQRTGKSMRRVADAIQARPRHACAPQTLPKPRCYTARTIHVVYPQQAGRR